MAFDTKSIFISSDRKINFTANVNDLADAKFYIVAVPTPVDGNKKPNLNALISATQMVATVLKKGDYVVFESTVYPGCTEEVCQPILENKSGLKVGVDFTSVLQKIQQMKFWKNSQNTVHTLFFVKNFQKI